MNQHPLPRRRFLAQSAAAMATAFAAPAIVRASTLQQKLHVAAIGVNGMGWSDLSNIGSHAKVKFVGF